ncbi:MAG: translocation/assembly module TamB domain-containing protein [Magnetococcales bacterium]|nr:translocation/assembly module TamB domain-containing protein [Magnetococcales bacterium]
MRPLLFLRHAVRLLGLSLLGALFLLVGTTFFALRTPAGVEHVERAVNHMLALYHVPVTLRGISGRLPFQIRVAHVEWTDAQGVWADVENLTLTWSGWALLRGVVRIQDLQASDFSWYRQPQASASQADSPSPWVNTPLLAMGLPLVALEAEHFAVERIHLGGPLSGFPAALFPGGSIVFSLQGECLVPLPVAAHATPLPGPECRMVAVREGLFTLAARGSLSADWLAEEATIDISLPDLHPWGPALGQPLRGAAQLTLQTRGAFQKTRLNATLDGDHVQGDNLYAEHLHATLETLFSLTSWEDVPVKLAMTGSIGTWRVQGIQGKPLRLTGEGTWDPRTLAGKGMVTTDLTDLASWLALAHPDKPGEGGKQATPGDQKMPDGDGRLHVDYAIFPAQKKLDLQASLALHDLRAWPAPILALSGPTPTLSAHISGDLQEGDFTLTHARLEGTGLSCAGHGRYQRASRSFTADWQGELADLRLLAKPLAHPVAGRIRGSATMHGSIDDPHLQVVIRGEKIVWNRQPVDHLQAQLQVQGFPAKPDGEVRLTAEFPGGTTRTEAHFRLQGKQLDLSRLRVEAPAGNLTGQLHTEMTSGLTEGALRVGLPRLSSLGPLLGVAMTGQGKVQVDLQARHGQQEFTAILEGEDWAGSWGSVQRVHGYLQGKDLWKKAWLQGNVTATQGRHGPHRLEHFRMETSGELRNLAVNLAARGEFWRPFTLDGAGTLRLAHAAGAHPASMELAVDQLSGKYGKDSLRLTTPFQIVQHKTYWDLSPFDLSLGRARLVAHLHLASQDISGRMVFHVPLSLATVHLETPWAGDAEGYLDLSGTADQPNLVGAINLLQLHAKRPAWTRVPPLNAKVMLAFAEQTLKLNADLTNLNPGVLHLDGSIPVKWRGFPLHGELPPQTKLVASLRADLRMEQLAAFLDLPQQELTGRLQSDLRLDGALEQLGLTGSIHVTEGRYLHLETGAEFKNISLEARAMGRTLTLTRLSADSGAEGHVLGTGTFSLLPESGFPLQIDLDLDQVKPLHNQTAIVLADGRIRVAGPLLAPRIAGSITLGESQIFLTDPEAEEMDSMAVEEEMNGVPLERVKIGTPVRENRPTLDLEIRSPGRLVTRGRGIDVEWSGEVKVTGSYDSPELRGVMHMQRGQIDLLGQRFQAARGTIHFTGSVPPNPLTDLDATLQRKNLQVTLRLQGPIRSPTLSFVSDPPLAQDDIIANILFGRTTAEINPTQAATLALALRTLNDGDGQSFLDRFQKAIGISKLDFAPGDRPETGVVKVGKYINDKIFLQVERGLASGTGGVSVEMDMTHNLSLKTEMHEEKSQEVGINWKHQY